MRKRKEKSRAGGKQSQFDTAGCLESDSTVKKNSTIAQQHLSAWFGAVFCSFFLSFVSTLFSSLSFSKQMPFSWAPIRPEANCVCAAFWCRTQQLQPTNKQSN